MSPSASRRGLLRAALLAPAAAACTRSKPAPARVDPDLALRDAAIAREQSLLALYRGATSRAAVEIRSEHEQHLVALGAARPSPSAAPTPAAAPPTVVQLVAAEHAAGAGHAADALRASGPLAAVLASLAASEASHPVALG